MMHSPSAPLLSDPDIAARVGVFDPPRFIPWSAVFLSGGVSFLLAAAYIAWMFTH
jgi:hypothetical protein